MNHYIFPPSNLEFNVTINEPIHTRTNTSANSGPPSLELGFLSAVPCKTVAIKVHSSKGPQRSPI